MNRKSLLSRLALVALAGLALGSTAFAGPGPMPVYMMMHGKMWMCTPMTKDMMCKNGCKVGMNGMMTMPKAKGMMLKEGEAVSADGVMMKPGALKLHGGG